MEDTHMERLEALACWADKSGHRGVIVKVTDLKWAVDRLHLLHEMIGDDMDLEGQLAPPTVYAGTGWAEERE
jgi:hypothetical protein